MLTFRPLPLITCPNREASRGLDSTAATPQYRRGGCTASSNVPECSDGHELETLMPRGIPESGPLPEEAPEEQSLMASANPGKGEDAQAPDPKVKNLQRGRGWGGRGSTSPAGPWISCCCFFARVDGGIIVVIWYVHCLTGCLEWFCES